jgi:IS30 family transposase
MPRIYTHLTTQERAVVMTMRDDQCSIRSIAARLGRSPSSISRELRRAPGSDAYDATWLTCKVTHDVWRRDVSPNSTPTVRYFR